MRVSIDVITTYVIDTSIAAASAVLAYDWPQQLENW